MNSLDKRRYTLYIVGAPELYIPGIDGDKIDISADKELYIKFTDEVAFMQSMSRGTVHLSDTLIYTNAYINRYALSNSLLGFTSRKNMASDADVFIEEPHGVGELVWIITTYALLTLSGDDPEIYNEVRIALGGPMGAEHIKVSNRKEFLEYVNCSD